MLEDITNTLKDISDTVRPAMPITSLACYAVGVFIGRKFCFAVGCRIAGIVSAILGKQNIAEKFNKVSSNYWTLAKKDALRDLTGAIGFIAGGFLVGYAEQFFPKEYKEKDTEHKVVEPHFLEEYPVLNFLWHHPKSTLTATGLSILGITWTFRRILCLNYRIGLKVQRNLLSDRIHRYNQKNPFEIDINELLRQRDSYNYWINLIKNEHRGEYNYSTTWINDPQLLTK